MRHSRRQRPLPDIVVPPPNLPPTALTVNDAVTVRAAVDNTYKPGYGFVHNHLSSALRTAGGTVAAAMATIETCALQANVHTAGFSGQTDGPSDLWKFIASPPSPTAPYKSGVWTQLDTRLELYFNAGLDAYVSLLCPGWMTYAGTTGDGLNGDAGSLHPKTEHIASMADLAQRIVQRYRVGGVGNPGGSASRISGGIEMWNEWKGLWVGGSWQSPAYTTGGGRKVYGWDEVRMTENYNAVWDAVKDAVDGDPSVRVGGPYQNFKTNSNPNILKDQGIGHPAAAAAGDADYLKFASGGQVEVHRLDDILYWWANKHGCDFYIGGAANSQPDEVIAWIHANLSATVPVVQGEMYPGLNSFTSTVYAERLAECRAQLAENLRKHIVYGWSAAHIWGPEEDFSGSWTAGLQANFAYQRAPGCPLTHTGELTQILVDHFVGQRIVQCTGTDPEVTGLATATHILAINRRQADIAVNANGAAVTVPGWDWLLVVR